ncbi:MAG: ferrous iron transport protein A [Thermoanaerobaculaceae bacterium]|nr:ferrous iron transport protein A [Thermoanaerobaculaceae bacterium]MDI9622413.1 FeoA family protein [Acidobacteriota bacterium]HPW54314.1 FeoA family protein [Thermoanaerobaculaceae bacterium]
MRQNHNTNRGGRGHGDGSIFGLSGFVRHRPHRDEEGETNLAALAPGVAARVLHLYGGRELVTRLAALGFTPGTEVRVEQNFGRGPLIVNLRGTRLALGRRESGRVHVLPLE